MVRAAHRPQLSNSQPPLCICTTSRFVGEMIPHQNVILSKSVISDHRENYEIRQGVPFISFGFDYWGSSEFTNMIVSMYTCNFNSDPRECVTYTVYILGHPRNSASDKTDETILDKKLSEKNCLRQNQVRLNPTGETKHFLFGHLHLKIIV